MTMNRRSVLIDLPPSLHVVSSVDVLMEEKPLAALVIESPRPQRSTPRFHGILRRDRGSLHSRSYAHSCFPNFQQEAIATVPAPNNREGRSK
jgi:hypothetical protein